MANDDELEKDPSSLDESATENRFDLDETVEETGDLHEESGGRMSETIQQDDLDATVEEDAVAKGTESDPNRTLEETDATVLEDGFDPDATALDLDQTVREDSPPSGSDEDPNATVVETEQTINDPDATLVELDQTVDASHATVADANLTVRDDTLLGETLDPDATVIENEGTVFDGGTVLEGDADLEDGTVLEEDATLLEDEGTVLQDDATVIDETIVTGDGIAADATIGTNDGTVLTDANISQTINPRELSEEDVSYWSKLSQEFHTGADAANTFSAFESAVVGSALPLRGRQVTTPQQSETEASDYRLVRLLGEGGMGNVFVARQGSLDRLIAVKIIKPLDDQKREKLQQQGRLKDTENSRRQQFLTEAVITGDLDHPNIVPIHDVAVTGENTLFYAMKRVVGTPWNKVIQEKSRDENLEILIKVADAIAFAHTRGIIHRDIKPENVMLGDFGVVMVMDWGIALATPQFEKLNSITPAKGLGGTPSFMSPEMATGPLESIGPASDVYLLGATLFMIVTGKAPHHAKNVRDCLRAVANNEIRDVDSRYEGELLRIARKAMATRPEDRYASVPEFQDAIREYRSHSESIALASRAADDLASAEETLAYTSFSRATFGFEEALHLWDGNQKAREGIANARLAHAEAAYGNKDFDLGLSLLKPKGELLHSTPEHQSLAEKLELAIQDRKKRESRFTLLKRAAAAMLLFIFVGGAFALVTINAKERKATRLAEEVTAEYERAEAEKNRAEENLSQANANLKLAEEKEQEANANAKLAAENEATANENARKAKLNAAEARQNAEEAKRNEAKAIANGKLAERNAIEAERNADEAKQNAEAARLAQAEAEYESYVSRVGLAKARVDRNEFADARRILEELIAEHRAKHPQQSLPWELRWLQATANQAAEVVRLPRVASMLALSTTKQPSDVVSGQLIEPEHFGVLVDENGGVSTVQVKGSRIDVSAMDWKHPESSLVTSAAVMSSGERIVLGTLDGKIELWSRDLSQRLQSLPSHDGPVNDLVCAGDRHLLSASSDRTVRVWRYDPDRSTIDPRFTPHWHVGPVEQVDGAVNADELWFASAVNEAGRGRVDVWKAELDSTEPAIRQGRFAKHESEVSAIAVWFEAGDDEEVPMLASGDTAGKVWSWNASDLKESDPTRTIQNAVQSLTSRQETTTASSQQRLGVTKKAEMETPVVHTGGVRDIRYDEASGQLVSAGNDYLAKVWRSVDGGDHPTMGRWECERVLRGHGGAVRSAVLLPGTTGDVLSLGDDPSLRYWDAATGSLDTDQAPQASSDFISRVDAEFVNESGDEDPLRAIAHDDEIWSARFSSDGQRVVTSSRDHTARILTIDPHRNGFLEQLTITPNEEDSVQDSLVEGTAFGAMSMRVDPLHRRLFLGNADAIVRLWDLDRGTEIGTLRGTGLNDVLALSEDGKWIATGASSPDADVLVWELDAGATASPRLRYQWKGHEESVAALAISSDNRWLFSGDRAGRGRIWDLRTGEPHGDPIDDLLGSRINAAAFASDGQSLWIGSDNQSLMRWDLESQRWDERLSGEGAINSIVLSPSGDQAITIEESQRVDSVETQVVWWDLAEDRRQSLVKQVVQKGDTNAYGGRPLLNSVSWDDEAKRLRVAVTPVGEDLARVETFDLSGDVGSAKRIAAFELPGQLGACGAVSSLPNERFLTMHGNSAFLWDEATQSHRMSYRAHGAVTRAAFASHDQRVITASRSVKIWNATTGKTVGKLESPHEGTIRAVALVPTHGFRFVTGGDDSAIRVWNFDESNGKFQQVRQWQDPLLAGGITSLDVSPDAKTVLATTHRGTAALLDLESDEQTVLLADPSVGKLNVGRFSKDGQWVVVGGDDKVARLWRMPSRENDAGQSGVNTPIEFVGHAEPIVDAVVQLNPIRILTASRDRSVRVWDPAIAEGSSENKSRGRVLLELRDEGGPLSAMDLTSDGDLLVTASEDGSVRLWPATSADSPN
ncbi:protein kinase [Rhodopirellula sp. JC740]|uniref:Protein kinase n=1 Tax=Rhodopirellula halodulae TaxID=2894198 RepID=A0ABS8NJH7_9BACT|nr:protein kinase [Rhodopirellula sp. JC740]MCC9643695.1 protein kinase [Rhodopirellula sp. JC740]